MAVANHAATTLAPSPAATDDLEYALEALLFMASEPLGVPELVQLLQQSESEIAATLRRLTRRYAKRGLRVTEQQGRYCLKVAPTAEKAILAYHQEPGFLSDAAHDVLALVAYLQPITASRSLPADSSNCKARTGAILSRRCRTRDSSSAHPAKKAGSSSAPRKPSSPPPNSRP